MNISFSNQVILNQIQFILDTLDNNFTENDLDQINELTIDYHDFNEPFSWRQLLPLKKLKVLNLKNFIIDNNDFLILSTFPLEELLLDNCIFENANIIANMSLKKLSIINCKIDDYIFLELMQNLNHLSIVNGREIISRLNKKTDLKFLQISYSFIDDIDTYFDLPLLEEIHIDNTNIMDMKILSRLPKLKRIGIDNKQLDFNKDYVRFLLTQGVVVTLENMEVITEEVLNDAL